MNTKLTLSIESEIIDQAKAYAKKTGRSLSDIIESYLKVLTNDIKADKLSPKTRKLMGSVKLPADLNPGDEYSDYLSEKHS